MARILGSDTRMAGLNLACTSTEPDEITAIPQTVPDKPSPFSNGHGDTTVIPPDTSKPAALTVAKQHRNETKSFPISL
ncbi:hypothetical protein VNO78_15657 [Psophocarpus tetragonolobus]|uniref:Uncharacterized protein n=1 Tax=Psophocarpus tetragonolobus TaxID=3891 RepID=A0AAN9XJT3_PSOTE